MGTVYSDLGIEFGDLLLSKKRNLTWVNGRFNGEVLLRSKWKDECPPILMTAVFILCRLLTALATV